MTANWTLRIGELFHRRRAEILLLLMVAIYSTVFSYCLVLKFQTFGIYAYDFGIYHQAIHTTATSGDLFYCTVELPYTQTALPPGTQFAVHFSPILFLVVPIYSVLQSPITLIVFKTLFLALGAVPVFFLAKRVLGSSHWGLMFAAAYLLYPAMQGINWYDFQPQFFFPPLVLFTALFIEYKKTGLIIVFSILTLSTIEIAPFFVIAMALSYLVIQRKSILEFLYRRNYRALMTSPTFILIVLSLLWLAIVFLALTLFGWQTSFHSSLMRRVTETESSAISLIGTYGFDWQAKLQYVLLLLGPLAFLSLAEPVRFFPGALWILYVTASIYPPYYSISFQYPTFIVPFVMLSAIFGIQKIRKKFISTKKRGRLLAITLCCTIGLSVIIASPIGAFHYGNHPWSEPYGIPMVTEHDRQLQKLVDLIPKNASVLTNNFVFAHVSDRKNAYVLPFSTTFEKPDDFTGYLDSLVQKVDYVLIDTNDKIAITIFSNNTYSRDFGVLAEVDGSILYKRAYSGRPLIFVPYEITLLSNDLTLINGQIVDDLSSKNRKAILHSTADTSGDFWHGPAVYLSRGNFTVNFNIKISGNSTFGDPLLVLAVVNWPSTYNIKMEGSESRWWFPNITLSSLPQEVSEVKPIFYSDFSALDSYQLFTANFSVTQPAGYEFVGLNAKNDANIFINRIDIRQVTP